MYLANLPINLPDHSTQYKIAEILSSLDAKIELNRRMNQTLEKTAKTLFQQYFIDEVNVEDLGVLSLLELATLIGGGTPKTSVQEFWDGDIIWVSAKDVTPNDGTFIIDSERNITSKGIQKSSAKLLLEYSTIITARGTVGKVCIV